MQAVEIEGYRIEDACAPGEGVQLLRARQRVNDSAVLLQLWDSGVSAAQLAIRQLAGLRHPGLATVLDVGVTADGRAYAALAAPAGPALRQRLAQGLDLADSLSLLRRLALILRFVETRCPLLPALDAAEIFSDAQGRPVLTRLMPPGPNGDGRFPLQRLQALAFEALTGRAYSLVDAQLPDYLTRWQPVFELEPAAGTAGLLALLDRLEGRPASAATEAVASLPRPLSIPAALDSRQIPVPSSPSSDDPPRTLPAAQTGPARARDDSARAAPAAASSSPQRFATLRPGAASAPARAPTEAPDERLTGPSRRLEPQPKPELPARAGLHDAAPPAPSRMPLLLAGALAVPLLAAALWWAATTAPMPSQPAAIAGGDLRPAPTVPLTSDEQALEAEAATGPSQGYQPPDPSTDWTPSSPVSLDLATLPTVEDPLERLLVLARTNLQAGRLVAPPGRNALDRYLQALRIEQDHRATLQGVAELAALCLRQAMDAEAFEPRLAALDCVDRVAAAHPAANTVQQEAQRFRQHEHDRLVRAAEEALTDWRGEEANRLYGQAQRLQSDSAPAREGQARAAALGRTGYRFRDTLAGGSEGPELVVLNGLAWALSETRVREFEIYWQAAGRARFAAALPACRDRESLLRSSRKRDWRAPDFEQGPEHPVACVSFAMAQHYAEWLSSVSGQRYRLPSLAEWRAAAGRPPGACAANLRDQSAARVWNARDAATCSDGHAYTAPVSAAGEQSGLLGLWGNLSEWLVDCEAANCRQRLAAGGSWFSAADELEPRGFAAEPAFTTIGLRVVREIPPRE